MPSFHICSVNKSCRTQMNRNHHAAACCRLQRRKDNDLVLFYYGSLWLTWRQRSAATSVSNSAEVRDALLTWRQGSTATSVSNSAEVFFSFLFFFRLATFCQIDRFLLPVHKDNRLPDFHGAIHAFELFGTGCSFTNHRKPCYSITP